LHPAEDRRGIDLHTALLHHLGQVSIRDPILAIPSLTNQDDLDRKTAALEDGHLLGSLDLPFHHTPSSVNATEPRIKQRTRPMLGFKRFDSATVTISGTELAQKIQKHQLRIGTLGGRSATMPELWNAALAA